MFRCLSDRVCNIRARANTDFGVTGKSHRDGDADETEGIASCCRRGGMAFSDLVRRSPWSKLPGSAFQRL
jgi:hypothetical protein